MTTKQQLDNEDDKVYALILNGANRFSVIDRMAGLRNFRQTDRALQRLRKRVLVRWTREAGWAVVGREGL